MEVCLCELNARSKLKETHMLFMDDTAIEEKIQRINTIKQDFRQPRERRYAFESFLRDHYHHLQADQSPSQEYIAQSLNALHSALNEPELVEQQLLINFISAIIRYVENAGLGYTFSKAFMDRAIAVYCQAGFSPVDLYLEKASLLRLDELESTEREQAILKARAYAEAAQDKETQVRVLMSCAVYYTEVSKYKQSLQACEECEQLISHDSQFYKYKAKLLTLFGMNYTPLFRYQEARNSFLQAKKLLDEQQAELDKPEQNEIWVSTMETIHHYLARIAEAQGDVREAMRYYVGAYHYLQLFAEEPRARFGFFHLRMGELLTSASLLEQARDHLRLGQEIFDAIQFSSSGRLQVSLAWAALYNKEGNYIRARDYILAAKLESQNKHFSRGELWCLVKLFWLELGHFHLYRAFVTFVQAMSTWRNGELRRNEGGRLLGYYLLQVLSTPFKLLRRDSHTVMGAGTLNAILSSCTCPLHQPDSIIKEHSDHE